MSNGMVAFLAGLGGGYLQGRDRARKQAQEDEDRAAVKEQRDFLKAERDRVTATRNRMADAAAPVTMQSVMEKPDYADNRDVGQPGVELIDTGARRVGQQTFAPGQMEQAAAALKEANTPQARNARMAEVLDRAGEPVQAQQLRTGARQEQLADLQLNAAQRQHLNQAFDDSLAGLTSFDDIAATVSKSSLGGSMKLRAVPGKDGKTVGFVTIGPDGKETPTAYSFANTPQGLLEAKAAVSKVTPIHQKLDFLFKKSADERANRQADEQGRHNRAMEGIAGDRTAANIEIASIRAAAAAKAGAGAPGGLTMADLKDAHKAIASTLNADYKTQIDAEMDATKSKAIKTTREREIALVQRLYTGAAQAGIAMTPEQAIAAFRTGEVGKQSFKTKDGGTATVDVIRVNGRVIPLMDEPGVALAVPAPAPAAATAAPAAGMRQAAPPAAAPAAPPPPPGATGDRALAAIEQQNIARMGPLNDAVNAARAQLQAVVKSGDPVALSRYAQELQQAIDARKAAAEQAFGNRAPGYLAGLGQ